jgi:hypothetical protein
MLSGVYVLARPGELSGEQISDSLDRGLASRNPQAQVLTSLQPHQLTFRRLVG